MKFEQYVKALNNLLKDNPAAKEYIVVAASDDEGNGFNPVHYSPAIGFYEDREFETGGDSANAVCLN